MQIGAAVAGVLVAAVVFRRVAREEIKHESTATDEMWSRTLQDFQNDERRAGRFPGHPDTGVQQPSRG